METRKYDMFTDMIANPSMSIDDFKVLGFTPENTSLHSRDTYMNDPWVLKQEMFLNADGSLNKDSFNKAYDTALLNYNYLSTLLYNDSSSKIFHRDNIYAPKELRHLGPEFKEFKSYNPYDITSSTVRLGIEDDRRKSVDELALANKVLLNPTTAGDDLSKAYWGDSPNDSFWGYFTDTLVQALWDSEGEHLDPFSGKMVHHAKGDLKTDKDGNFYYEKLDGRDIYGRRVLNKMNVLTTDGSWANQYDFFDSDDILLKGIGSSTLKNLALVGSMFLPYVGPVVTALSIGQLLVGLGGTFGKMIAGSDNPTFSAMEGWSKSMSRQGASTEYAQEHPFCWENMINMIGDVAGLLRELRFVFDMIPGLVSGKVPELAKLAKELESAYKKEKFAELQARGIKGTGYIDAIQKILMAAPLEAASKARLQIESAVKALQNLGAILSKGYMTAITVGDTYGEAKAAGATDLEATLLTIGHAAGEYAILNTGLGEMILPELRASGIRNKAIAKALTTLDKEKKALGYKDATALLSNAKDKRDWVLKLFKIGKDIATAEYATGERTAKAMGAAALGESMEEVSEEILADFSKGCFDAVQWLQGDDTRINTFGYDFSKGEWDSKDFLTRYGMSALGGFIGGGLANAGMSYKQIKSYNGMTSEQALLEVIYMIRNNLIDDFVKDVNKQEIADKNLSTQFEEVDGKLLFAPGTKEDNLDLAVKLHLFLEINTLKTILEASGGNLSDNKFLSKLTILDLRFNKLISSKTAGKYLLEYNSLNSQLFRITKEINDIIKNNIDSNNDGVVEDYESRRNKLPDDVKKSIKEKEKLRDEIINKIKDFNEGKRSYEFIRDTLYELSTPLNHAQIPATFDLFVKARTGKDSSELSELDLANNQQAYKDWVISKGRDASIEASMTFGKISEMVSDMLKELSDVYKHIDPLISAINELLKNISSITHMSTADTSGNLFSLMASELGYNLATSTDDISIRSNAAEFALRALGSSEIDAKINLLYKDHPNMAVDPEEAKDFRKEYSKLMAELLPIQMQAILLPYLGLGFANKETKQLLGVLLKQLLDITSYNFQQFEVEHEEEMVPPPNPYSDILNQIAIAQQLVLGLAETPIEAYLDKFSISMNGVPMKLTTLIDLVNKSFLNTAEDTSTFRLDDDLYDGVKNAISLLLLFKSTILAARTEINPFNTLYGYNATLNEVAQKTGIKAPELAEIDNQTADAFVSEIDADLSKLEFLKTLQEINRGQKLTTLDRVSTKTGVLFYKRFKDIINIPDDDDLRNSPEFLKLESKIKSLSLYSELAGGDNFHLQENQKLQFLLETIQMEDAIYDFFNSDLSLLERFITPQKLNLDKDENILLNEGATHIDDNSMIWYLAARVAVKASDFYSKYKDVIDPESDNPIAPITTQELAIYLDYANIMNGDIFAKIVKTYLKAMLKDWENKTIDLRKTRLSKHGFDRYLFLAEDNFTKYAFNWLPIPKYTNIVLTEGISGAGNIL